MVRVLPYPKTIPALYCTIPNIVCFCSNTYFVILIFSLWPVHILVYSCQVLRTDQKKFSSSSISGNVNPCVGCHSYFILNHLPSCLYWILETLLSSPFEIRIWLSEEPGVSACRCMITPIPNFLYWLFNLKDHMPSHPHIKVKPMTDLSILQPQANPHLLVIPPHSNARALPPLYPCDYFAPVCWLKC